MDKPEEKEEKDEYQYPEEEYKENLRRVDSYIKELNKRNTAIVPTKDVLKIKKAIKKEFLRKAKSVPEIDKKRRRVGSIKQQRQYGELRTNHELVNETTALVDETGGGVIFKNKFEDYLKQGNSKHPNINILKKIVEDHLQEIEELEKPFVQNFKNGLKFLKKEKQFKELKKMYGQIFIQIKAKNLLEEQPKKEQAFYKKYGIIPLLFGVYPATQRGVEKWNEIKKYRDHSIRDSPVWFEAAVIGKRIFFYEMQRNKIVRGMKKSYRELGKVSEYLDLFGVVEKGKIGEEYAHIISVKRARAVLTEIRKYLKEEGDEINEFLFKKFLDENQLEKYFKKIREEKHDKETAVYTEEFSDLLFSLNILSDTYEKYGLSNTKLDFFDELIHGIAQLRVRINRESSYSTMAIIFPFLFTETSPFEQVVFKIVKRKRSKRDEKYYYPTDQKDYADLNHAYDADETDKEILTCCYKSFLGLQVPIWWLKKGEIKDMIIPLENSGIALAEIIEWNISEVKDKDKEILIEHRGEKLPIPKEFIDVLINTLKEKADHEIDEEQERSFLEGLFGVIFSLIGNELERIQTAPTAFSTEAWDTITMYLRMVVSLDFAIKRKIKMNFSQSLTHIIPLITFPIIYSNLLWIKNNTNLKDYAETWITRINAYLQEVDKKIIDTITKNIKYIKKVLTYENGRYNIKTKEFEKYMIVIAEEYKELIVPHMKKITREDRIEEQENDRKYLYKAIDLQKKYDEKGEKIPTK